MGKLDNKVAIITGATSGMGRSTAYLFAKEGAKVVVVGRNEARGSAVVNNIKEAGGDAIFIQADMQDFSCADLIIDKTIKTYGRLDILFNNAGISINEPFTDLSIETYDKTMDVNCKMPFILTQKAMPYLLETKGNVLFTASSSGSKPTRYGSVYNMSKSAIIMLAKNLATHYADTGVRFNSISPGLTDTAILEGQPDFAIQHLKDTIPMKRLGDPEVIAATALFLASDEASYITGIDVLVDGALNLMI